ncbi:MAG: NADH-dependent [FeFe] hydrogenase, group A6 [Lentisphaerae bacterium]|nr:NADH-dependent [FeFe] hydrogenase, group A6 [Lentisphaerota bacterium]
MEMINLTVNDVPVSVEEDTTVLDAAAKAGIKIPTLCHFDGVSSPGSCRVCLVEIKGARTLQPSCVTKVSEGMAVSTNTKLARDARKLSVELMLANHPWDYNACARNNDCELQTLAKSMGITEVRFPYEKEQMPLDTSTPALVRDMNKCVLCRRCIGVCQDVQGVGSLSPRLRGFDTVIGAGSGDNLCEAVCVQCGQCSAVCPVGAIYEKDSIKDVWKELDNPDKYVIVQTAPAIRAALGECFGLKPGTLVTGKMVTALRRLGFKKVFDTNFTADLTIIEEGTELLTRLKTALVAKGEVSLPMFTSCSPGWINFMEYFYPTLLPNLSSCKSPQQMFGALAKTYFAEKAGIDPSKIIVVSIMPCTAKKFECDRDEMKSSGFKDVDYVLTTRELGRMITEAGIEFVNLEDGEQDAPMGMSTGAADIFANTGGVMEAALRTVYEIVTGRVLPMEKLHVKPVQGLKGLKEASVTLTGCKPDWSFLEGVTAKVAVAHGLSNARKACDLVAAGNKHGWHFIEVMCCPGGCIGGGGQPRLTTDAIRKARMKAIYKEDEGRPMRKSHDNPAITQIYKEFLHEPLGHKSHELLHTHYKSKAK